MSERGVALWHSGGQEDLAPANSPERCASTVDDLDAMEGVHCKAERLPSWQLRTCSFPDAAEIDRVIRADATANRIMSKDRMPAQGALVGVRLNLNILRSTGVCVHSLHRGSNPTGPSMGRGFWDGEVLGYAPVVTLEGAWFSVKQSGREAIARGLQAKHPMASIDGVLRGMHSLDGVEARFDPKTTHLFVDDDGYAVRWAQYVTVMGHRAYMRGRIVYHSAKTAPARTKFSAPSLALVRKGTA